MSTPNNNNKEKEATTQLQENKAFSNKETNENNTESWKTQFQNFTSKLEKRIEYLEHLESIHKEWEKTMEENARQQKEKIKLDVGGKIFAISKSTLLRAKGSYFYHMLVSNVWKPDSQDGYFIDRDPKYFNLILDYLRTGEIPPLARTLNSQQKTKLMKDLDYYQIEWSTFANPIWCSTKCSPTIKLSDEDRIATRTKDAGWNSSVQSVFPTEKFKVKVLAKGSMMIGFTTPGFRPSDSYTARTSYLMYLTHGSLYSSLNGSMVTNGTSYLGAVQTNDVVEGTVINKEISFSVNGVSKGTAFTNIVDSELFLSVYISDINASLEILHE